jgi:hypothetical protein
VLKASPPNFDFKFIIPHPPSHSTYFKTNNVQGKVTARRIGINNFCARYFIQESLCTWQQCHAQYITVYLINEMIPFHRTHLKYRRGRRRMENTALKVASKK